MVPDFTILEPLATYETNAVAEEMTENLINDHPDLIGLFIAGGGISGAMIALRTRGKSGKIMGLSFDLTENTRAGLLYGTLKMVLGHPLERLAQEAISGMVRASNWVQIAASRLLFCHSRPTHAKVFEKN